MNALLNDRLPDGLPGDESPYRQIICDLPMALYITDTEGHITFYNDAAAALWGRRPTLLEDRWCGSWRLYRADGQPMAHAECPMAITLRTGQIVRDVETLAERPDGSFYSFIAYPTLLRDAAGQITGAVSVLVDVTERKRAEEATERLAAIVASSSDAIVGKTLDGIITNWNEGAERLFGYKADEIIGKSVLTLLPPDRYYEETSIIARLRIGERIEHFETVRLHKDGRMLDVSLSISPIRLADGRIIGASKIARDITERKRAEAQLRRQSYRLATLHRVAQIISQDLDLERIVQSVTDIATDLSGARFGAFFYKAAEKDETSRLFALSGATRDAFEKFGLPRNTALFGATFLGEQVVRSDDIRTDPRYGHNVPHFGVPKGHPPVVSYLAVPVISSSGEVIGGLFFGHEEPGKFEEDTELLISGIALQAGVAMDNARLHEAARTEIERRRTAEEAQELLLNEIKHRVKNTLATVQAMAVQTFRKAPPHEGQAFTARLHALSGAHDLLTQQNWQAVAITDLVSRALDPFLDREEPRIATTGPEVRLDPNNALLLVMVLHELGTNAVKYGALSNNKGRVDVHWSLEDCDTPPCLRLCWREEGGPAVTPPTRKGFGSRMIERALRGRRGSAQFDFAPGGLNCVLEITL
ncbi:MAG TPA: PAS domain S-box protein [Sphingomonadaceae bacterium]|nr:PAS domain S-box protein [Sphingomonadaceae bacterium]